MGQLLKATSTDSRSMDQREALVPVLECRAVSPAHSGRATEPLLSVVIPTRHEADTIGAFIERLLRAVDGIPIEIVMVDDSDRDNTVQVLLALREKLDGRLVVLHRSIGSVPERTLGTAVVTGIRAARGTYVCVMDGDGQHPPEAIRAFLETVRRTRAEYVGGSRYMPSGSAEGLDGLSRQAISRGLALLTRLAFLGTPIRGLTDPLSGFFFFQRSLVERVDLRPIGWKISLEVLVRGRARHIAEVPYTFAKREGGDSKASLKQGLLVLQHIVVLLLSLQGVRRFLTFGAVGASGAVVNTGLLLTLAGLGFDALSWPIWAATEVAILWNYTWNCCLTWNDRPYRRWWLYNVSALGSAVLAVFTATALVKSAQAPLGFASLAGIALGMLLNYLAVDRVVFSPSRQLRGVLKRSYLNTLLIYQRATRQRRDLRL